VLLAAFLLILHRYVREGTRWVWALPPMQVIWINTHGGALLGVEIAFAFALGETLQALCRGRMGGPAPMDRGRRQRLWIVAFACLAACAVNPWGMGVLRFAVRHMRMESILSWTSEWLPALHPQNDIIITQYIGLAAAAGALFSFILNARNARLSCLIVSALTSLLLIKGLRFTPDVLIANLPILALNLSERFPSARISGARASWAAVAAAFLISAFAVSFGLPLTTKGEMQHGLGLGAARHSAPSGLVDFLKENDIRGRILNDMALGGYLIFRRWPGERVFIDGRTPVYGDRFFKDYVEALKNGRNFDEYVKRYNVDYLVFASFMAWDQREIHRRLWEGPDWRLVYAEYDGMVYLKETPGSQEKIRRLALPRNPVVDLIKQEEEWQRRQKSVPLDSN